MLVNFFRIAVICLLGIALVPAQAETRKKRLADESMNPLSTLITLPFENNTYFNNGPSKTTANVLNIKPIYPIDLIDLNIKLAGWNLINRFTIPIVYTEGQEQEVLEQINLGGSVPGSFGVGSAFGLADITYQGFLTRSQARGTFNWGVGAALVFPTGTEDRFTSEKWSGGPAIVGVNNTRKWFLGLIMQNVWDFAGDEEAADVNSFQLQYTINYKMGNGYYITSAPIITANWEAESGNQWAVPFGAGLGRVFKLGDQAIAVDVGGYYYVERPQYHPNWYAQILVNFLFPKR